MGEGGYYWSGVRSTSYVFGLGMRQYKGGGLDICFYVNEDGKGLLSFIPFYCLDLGRCVVNVIYIYRIFGLTFHL